MRKGPDKKVRAEMVEVQGTQPPPPSCPTQRPHTVFHPFQGTDNYCTGRGEQMEGI